MQWRNEQIYHLRQDKPLTIEDQDNYFNFVIDGLFNEDFPDKILFSFLENGMCVGYGGLVHINWINKNAEISFIMETKLEQEFFHDYWKCFLKLIEDLAFNDIKLHKIYTFAYDIRPNLFKILEHSDYVEEAILFEHVFINGCYINVRIHSKFNKLK